MPQNADGLVLRDKGKGYQKLNCEWGKVARGPAPGKAGERGKRKCIEKPIKICFSLNEDHYAYIKKQALMKSSEQGEIVTPQEMIREALIKAFPCPGYYDMFGGKTKRKSA